MHAAMYGFPRSTRAIPCSGTGFGLCLCVTVAALRGATLATAVFVIKGLTDASDHVESRSCQCGHEHEQSPAGRTG